MLRLKGNLEDDTMGDFIKNDQRELRSVITTYLPIQAMYQHHGKARATKVYYRPSFVPCNQVPFVVW